MIKEISFILLIFFQISCFLSCNDKFSHVSDNELDSMGRILNNIFEDDQKNRLKIDKIESEYGRNSNELNNLWDTIQIIDSINQIKVIKILDEFGWLGKDDVGWKANIALFLVIQHSELEIQKKYLPLLHEAVKEGKAEPGNLAYLEDRIAVQQNKKQIYGSQLEYDTLTGKYHALPIEDPENVDKRRKKMGLLSLEEYISKFEQRIENIKQDSNKKINRKYKSIDSQTE